MVLVGSSLAGCFVSVDDSRQLSQLTNATSAHMRGETSPRMLKKFVVGQETGSLVCAATIVVSLCTEPSIVWNVPLPPPKSHSLTSCAPSRRLRSLEAPAVTVKVSRTHALSPMSDEKGAHKREKVDEGTDIAGLSPRAGPKKSRTDKLPGTYVECCCCCCCCCC